MPRIPDPKGRTLAAAAQLFRQQGYYGTALQDVLAASGAPRGSLYFHFPGGKEQIGVAALTLAGDSVLQVITRAAETAADAEAFLTRVIRTMAADLAKSGYKDGCPIATTALETAAQSEALAAAARAAFDSWEREIKRALFRFGLPAGDADLIATIVLSQLEGALLLARTTRSLVPLERAELVLQLLLRERTG